MPQFLRFKCDGSFGPSNPKMDAANSTVTPIINLQIETVSYKKAFNRNLYRINHNVVTNFFAIRITVQIQCIKLCVYSQIPAVKTQQISQIVSLYHKKNYVIYNNYMFRPCKRAIIRLFTEPSNRLHNRRLGGRDLALHDS